MEIQINEHLLKDSTKENPQKSPPLLPLQDLNKKETKLNFESYQQAQSLNVSPNKSPFFKKD